MTTHNSSKTPTKITEHDSRTDSGDKQLPTLRGLQFWLYATNILSPYLPVYFSAKGYTSSQIGTMMMLGPLLAVLFQPFWGYLSDKLGTVKKIIAGLWAMSILSSIGLFQSSSYGSALFFATAVYFFWLPTLPLMDSITIKATEKRGVTYGSIRLFGSMGYMTILIGTGVLFGSFIGIGNLSYLFWALWIPALMLLLRLRDEPTEGERMTLASLKPILQNKSFLWFLLLVFIMSVPHRMHDVMFSLYLRNAGGSEALVGYSWALHALFEIPAFALLNKYLHKVRELTLLGIVCLLYTLRWTGYALAPEPWVMVLLQAGAIVTYAVFWLTAVYYTVRVLPKQLISTGQSLLSMVYLGLAGMTGGTVGGWLFDHFGATSIYWFAAAASLVAGCAFLATEFVAQRRTFRR
jgi:PPP family 3-phenylpropionic acid transporter